MYRSDLSALLREQAATVTDHAGASRADAVRRRARRTQQRRTFAAAVATIAAAAGTIGIATLPGDRELNLAAGDFGYSTTARADQQSLREWRAVSTAGLPVAVAVYEFSKPPTGHTHDEITFPQTLAGSDLIDGVVGEKGQRQVSVSVPSKTRRLHVVTYCAGVANPEGYGVAVSFDGGQDKVVGTCDDDPAPTVVRSSDATVMLDTQAHEARARLVDSAGRNIAPPAGAQIGVALYDSVPTRAGNLRESLEYDGHLWRLQQSVDRAVEPTDGGEEVSLPVDSRGGPVVVAWATKAPASATVSDTMRLLIDAREVGQATVGGEALTLISHGRKSRAALEVEGARGSTDAALGVYRLVR